MTKTEYHDLVDFLGVQFGAIRAQFRAVNDRFINLDKRFTGLDPKFASIDERFNRLDERMSRFEERMSGFEGRMSRFEDRMSRFEDRLTRVEVLGEDALHKIGIVGGGVTNVDRKVEALRSDTDAQINELRTLLQLSHSDLDRRLTRIDKDWSCRFDQGGVGPAQELCEEWIAPGVNCGAGRRTWGGFRNPWPAASVRRRRTRSPERDRIEPTRRRRRWRRPHRVA